MNNKILVVHPTGNQNSRAIVRGLANAGKLHTFVTALNIDSKRYAWLPKRLVTEIQRRDFNEINGNIVSGASFKELLRLLASRLKLKFLIKPLTGYASIDAIYKATQYKAVKILKKHASEITAVYCYEGAALEVFKLAKDLNIKCFYEQPAGYWKFVDEIQHIEIMNNHGWASTWPKEASTERKNLNKDLELSLADRVIVASSYTKNSLKMFSGKISNVEVIPYGFPNTIIPSERLWYEEKKKLKVLFVGGLRQLKGLSYLVEALKGIESSIEFSFIGSGPALSIIQKILPNSNYLGSLAHSQVLELMRANDVLVFPSLSDGFGMVVTEAMSQGMVVIASENTALPDIADQDSSILIPIRDAEAIRIALENLIIHPELVRKLGKNALHRAQAYPWKTYESEIVKVIFK